MKVRDIIKLVEVDGWYLVGVEGDHRQFKHPTKKGRVTIAGKMSADMPIKTFERVCQQAQIPKPRR